MVSAASSLGNAFRDIAARYEAEHVRNPGAAELRSIRGALAADGQGRAGGCIRVGRPGDDGSGRAAQAGCRARPAGVRTQHAGIDRPARRQACHRADGGSANGQTYGRSPSAMLPVFGRPLCQARTSSARACGRRSAARPFPHRTCARCSITSPAAKSTRVSSTQPTPRSCQTPSRWFSRYHSTPVSAIRSPSRRMVPNTAEARRFVTYVISPEAQAILRGHGFQGP
jgi:hypothetical protein